VSETNVTEFYRATANPKLNEGFFARYIILCEGETEELALPLVLAHVGIDCDLHGVSVLGVGGKNQLPKYWRLFTQFDLPTLVLFDNDNDDADKQRSNRNIAACMGVEMSDFTERVAICKVLEANRPGKTPLVVLEKDFEHALDRDYREWSSDQFADADDIQTWRAEAREYIKPEGNQGKGLIARFAARRMCAAQPEFVPLFAHEIATRVSESLGIKLNRMRKHMDDVPF